MHVEYSNAPWLNVNAVPEDEAKSARKCVRAGASCQANRWATCPPMNPGRAMAVLLGLVEAGRQVAESGQCPKREICEEVPNNALPSPTRDVRRFRVESPYDQKRASSPPPARSTRTLRSKSHRASNRPHAMPEQSAGSERA